MIARFIERRVRYLTRRIRRKMTRIKESIEAIEVEEVAEEATMVEEVAVVVTEITIDKKIGREKDKVTVDTAMADMEATVATNQGKRLILIVLTTNIDSGKDHSSTG